MTTNNDSHPVTRRLGDLLRGVCDADLSADAVNRSVTGLFDDSRRVTPDSVFVAIRGTGVDGRRFIDAAVRAGAIAIVGEELPKVGDVCVVNAPNARVVLARLATRWYGLDQPAAAALRLLGVTGTNGKTTVAHMTQAILSEAGLRCGLFGTVRHDLCGSVEPARMTTPGPLELARLLRTCVDNGADAVVMEVSSHALSQCRTDGLHFTAAAFTNLTQDHLDYHATLDEYAAAKARLFTNLADDATAVLNVDDAHAATMRQKCAARGITYAIDTDADLRATDITEKLAGTTFTLQTDERTVDLELALPGRHNVYNALASAGLASAIGVSLDEIASGLGSLPGVPGRLQRVPCPGDVDVFVDYAHTDDALRNVARTLRPLARGRMLIVFGCGGDRDRGKRPRMAQAATEFADMVVLTSDNPRTEDPRRIVDDALAGLDSAARRKTVVELDRRAAIRTVLTAARPGDMVLIAGRGHETSQVIGTQRVQFDDVEVAAEAAAELGKERVEQ